MLTKLTVENYALIERLDLELDSSLNMITGETGAGKSILLGALALLLGARADAAAIMDKERNCVIEGVFSLDGYGLEQFFEDNDLDYSQQTVVRRVITPAGKSRAYINDLPVQLTVLKEFGTRVIDIHSQHQSLMLSDDGFRTGIVDAVAAQGPLLAQYKSAYESLKAAERELAALKRRAEESRRDEEYIRFQYDQLAAAALKEGEQDDLEQQQKELANAGQIGEALALSVHALEEDQTGVLTQLKTMEQVLEKLVDVYPRSVEIVGRIHSVREELKDLYGELNHEYGRVEADPEKLAFVDERLDTIYGLQQKHRVESVVELIELQGDYRTKLDLIESSDEEIAGVSARIVELESKALALAAKITAGRKKASVQVHKYAGQMLGELGMPNGRLEVEITPAGALRHDGVDEVGFLFSANKNIAPQPLEKVASGGETSRLMLALKSLVAKSVKLPTIIFDEIDTGVSGQIADAMGNIISALGDTMQVVNITHLPQVASKGRTHFVVYKDDSGTISRTRISMLSPEERIGEIAKMLSGSTITEAAVQQAKLLLSARL